MSRRALFASTLAIVAIALVALGLKFWPGAARVTNSASSDPAPADTGPAKTAPENSAPQDEAIAPTSETLIAEALAAKDITYEESLLQRAYALFNDPRLQMSFRSEVVNWEAIGPLLDDITEKETTLNQELLDDLRPFRVRPNDPRSILNRPRAEVLKTQPTPPPPPWVGREVPGTDLMVWIRGAQPDLDRYVTMAGRIWRAFPPFFTYPLKDRPGNAVGPFNSTAVNPPGYVLIDRSRGDNAVLDTMAHELTHVSQLAYDTDERGIGAEGWMIESTATYVAYQVVKSLKVRAAWEYRLIDRSEPIPRLPRWPSPPLFENLHRQLHRTGNNYSGFLFFYSASMDLGDSIVKQVWQRAAPRGQQGIDAVAPGHPPRRSLSAIHRAELESGSRAETVQGSRRHVLAHAASTAGEEHA